MSTYQSLRELVEDLEVEDWCLWIGKHAVEHVGKTSAPNRVTTIDRNREPLRVEGKGVGGGQYHFEVYSDGTSKAFYHNPNKMKPTYQGPVVVARITDSKNPVPVRCVFDDTRT